MWHTRTVLTRRRQSKANSTNSHANDNNNNNNKPGNRNGNFECWLGRLYQNWCGAAAAAAGYDSILNRVSHGHKADTDTEVCTQITKTTLATAAATITTTTTKGAANAGDGLHKGGVWASSACALLQLTFWLRSTTSLFLVVAAAGGRVSLIVIMWVTGQRAVVIIIIICYLYLSSLLNSWVDCFIIALQNVALTKCDVVVASSSRRCSPLGHIFTVYCMCVFVYVCRCVCVDPT